MYVILAASDLPITAFESVFSCLWCRGRTYKCVHDSMPYGICPLFCCLFILANKAEITKLIWQYGDRHYKAKRWAEAADWYIIGSHKLFRTNSPTSAAKCFRKAALCHIERREYTQASRVIRLCPPNEAPTYYVMFLTAVHQGSFIRVL